MAGSPADCKWCRQPNRAAKPLQAVREVQAVVQKTAEPTRHDLPKRSRIIWDANKDLETQPTVFKTAAKVSSKKNGKRKRSLQKFMVVVVQE